MGAGLASRLDLTRVIRFFRSGFRRVAGGLPAPREATHLIRRALQSVYMDSSDVPGRGGGGRFLSNAAYDLGRTVRGADFYRKRPCSAGLPQIHFARSALPIFERIRTTVLSRCGLMRDDRLLKVFRIMSPDAVPRAMAKCFPSRERPKLKIVSERNLVNCFGSPPSIGWLQRLSTSDFLAL